MHLAHPTLVKPFAKDGLSTLEGEIRDLRTIVRYRASLVRLRIKNRVHTLLTREGIEPPKLLYLLILSELGEIGRFKRPESLVCYAGLAPKVEQSGEHVRYGLWGSAPCGVPPHHPEKPVRVYRKPCKGLTMYRGRHEEMNVDT